MPDLDDILQVGEKVPKTAFKQFLNDLTPSPDGEQGVINIGYAIGDVRRYGVFPDGTTNWQTAHPDRITAIFANSCLDGVEVYWPAGDYATGLNMDDTYDGSRMFFDNAVFYGILHLIDGVSDVVWRGEMSTYDRFGIASGGSTKIRIGTVHCLSDPAKNVSQAGIGGRGVHVAEVSDIEFELFDVVDCAAAASAAPGTHANLAAVWFECQGLSGIRGKIKVLNSQTNGVFVNALDVDLDIKVYGYGAQAIDADGVPLTGISLAQTELGFGVMLHRWTGRAALYVDQSNASPGADIYSIVIPETGVSSVSSSRHKVGEIYYLDATVGDSNRGVCIGGAEDQKVIANVLFSGPAHIRRRGSDSMASGYAGLNVLAPPAVASNYRRFMAASLSFSNFSSVLEFKAEGVATSALDNFTEVVINQINVDATSSGSISLVGNAATGGILKGSINNVHINWTGGSNATPSLDMSGCTNFNINGGAFRAATQVTATAIAAAACLNCRIAPNLIHNYGSNANGALAINADNKRCTFGPTELTRAGTITASAGVKFSGEQTDCIFQGLILIASFAVGFENGTSMSFTRCTAIQCTASSNTDDTDLTTANFPAANQLGCTNFAV